MEKSVVLREICRRKLAATFFFFGAATVGRGGYRISLSITWSDGELPASYAFLSRRQE